MLSIFKKNTSEIKDLAIIGRGFCGYLAAYQAIEQAADKGINIKIIDPDESKTIGNEIAYGNKMAGKEYILNPDISEMSFMPDDPEHYSSWLRINYKDLFNQASKYIGVTLYNEYAHSTLMKKLEEYPESNIDIIQHEASAINIIDDGSVNVNYTNGGYCFVDHVIIANGWSETDYPEYARARFNNTRFITNEWKKAPDHNMNYIPNDQEILIIGSDALADDAIATLIRQGHEGGITQITENNDPQIDIVSSISARQENPSGLSKKKSIRDRMLEKTYKSEVNIIEQASIYKQLSVIQGEIKSILAPNENQLQVEYSHKTPNNSGRKIKLTEVFDYIIYCHNLTIDPLKSNNNLIKQLKNNQVIKSHSSGIGIEIDHKGSPVDVNGKIQDRITIIGPSAAGYIAQNTEHSSQEALKINAFREHIPEIIQQIMKPR